MPSAAEIQKGLQKDAITQIANVSAQLREAVAASIPGNAQALQLMTVEITDWRSGPGSIHDYSHTG